jgi:hypothetical protein
MPEDKTYLRRKKRRRGDEVGSGTAAAVGISASRRDLELTDALFHR